MKLIAFTKKDNSGYIYVNPDAVMAVYESVEDTEKVCIQIESGQIYTVNDKLNFVIQELQRSE